VIMRSQPQLIAIVAFRLAVLLQHRAVSLQEHGFLVTRYDIKEYTVHQKPVQIVVRISEILGKCFTVY